MLIPGVTGSGVSAEDSSTASFAGSCGDSIREMPLSEIAAVIGTFDTLREAQAPDETSGVNKLD